jgi:hypothetical protein
MMLKNWLSYITLRSSAMKALDYHGPRDVQIDDKPRPLLSIKLIYT